MSESPLSLQVTGHAPRWRFTLRDARSAPLGDWSTERDWTDDELTTLLGQLRTAADDAALFPTRPGPALPELPLPRLLIERLRRLGAPTLLVEAGWPLDRLPWEALPAAWGLPRLRVVRQYPAPPRTVLPSDPLHALVIACGPLDDDARRELDLVAGVFGDRCVRLDNPTLAEIQGELAKQRLWLVHLRTDGSRAPDGSYTLHFVDDAGARVPSVPHAIASALTGAPLPALTGAPLPAPAAGPRPAQPPAQTTSAVLALLVLSGGGCLDLAPAVLGRAPGAAVLGWYGDVLSTTAADFALSFYSRLCAGRDLLGSLPAAEAAAGTLVVAVADRKTLDWKPPRVSPDRGGPTRSTPEQADRGGSTVRTDNYRGPSSPAAADAPRLELQLEPALCPALLVNDWSPVKALTLTSPVARRLHLHLSCDTGQGTSTWRATLDLEANIPWSIRERLSDLSFPALHELIERRVGRRKIAFTLGVSDGERVLAELTRATTYFGPTEWLNQESNWQYLPSYVLPDSAAAHELVSAAQQRLAAADVGDLVGRGKPDEIDARVAALYGALQARGIAYASPRGEVYLPDPGAEVAPAGQRVRFPNEVMARHRGTCHDLALLLAACCENAAIRPLLVLLRGHTFVGYWRDHADQRRYWEQRPARRPGDRWLITDRLELTTLIHAGALEVVEATALTRADPPVAFADARARAREHFTLRPQAFSCAVDVWAARAHVEPLYRAWTEE